MRIFALLLMLAACVSAQVLDTIPLRSRQQALSYRHVLNKLGSTPVTVSWEDQTIREAIKDLRRQLGLNFVVSGAVADAMEETITLKLRDVPGSVVLEFLVRPDMVFQHRRGVIYVTSPDDALKRATILRIYSVYDLLYVPPDFPGPKLGLHGSGFGDEEEEPAEAPEPKDPEQLIDLVKAATGIANWESDSVSISATRGRLIVRHTPLMQRKIARFIASLSGVY